MFEIRKFKLKYNFLFALIGLGLFGFMVQCKTAKLPAQNTDWESNALLWQISEEHSAHVSYLFGTIHMIPAEYFFLPEGTIPAFDEATEIYFEVDLDELSDPAAQMSMLQKSFMKDDVQLKDLITADDYQFIRAHFQKQGIPLMMFERVKPLFLSVFADDATNVESLNDGSIKFYEMEFMKMAQSQNKNVNGLESIDFQLGLMDSIPYEVQAKMLVESIKTSKEGSSEMDTLISLYTRQDISALHSSFDADSLSAYEQILLINRNQNWIPVMIDGMENNSCFFAVGAAHLGGPNGVIRLLEQKGYTLKPVLSE